MHLGCRRHSCPWIAGFACLCDHQSFLVLWIDFVFWQMKMLCQNLWAWADQVRHLLVSAQHKYYWALDHYERNQLSEDPLGCRWARFQFNRLFFLKTAQVDRRGHHQVFIRIFQGSFQVLLCISRSRIISENSSILFCLELGSHLFQPCSYLSRGRL